MEQNGGNDRPPKRKRKNSAAGETAHGGDNQPTAGASPELSAPEAAFRAAQSTFQKLVNLDPARALHLLESHPATKKYFQAATEQIDLKAALVRETEARKADKVRQDQKLKNMVALAIRLLQQGQGKLHGGMIGLRDDVTSVEPGNIVGGKGKDAEIHRLRGLVKSFIEDMSNSTNASVKTTCKMLGQPISQPLTNLTCPEISDMPETLETNGAEDQDAEVQSAEGVEGETAEDEESDSDDTPLSTLYSTDYVDNHPNETFYHRANGRWRRGLPKPFGTTWTAVRGPGAGEWKAIKHALDDVEKSRRDANAEVPEEQNTATSKPSGKAQKTAPSTSENQAQNEDVARKFQRFGQVIHDLEFKLRDVRLKLEEEVVARRKAENELSSMHMAAP